jgi:outer membrane lipoprotein-sorting protein
MKRIFATLVLFIFAVSMAFSIEAVDLIKKLDQNEVYGSIRYEGSMTIYLQGKVYNKTFTSYAKGNRNFFMEFTNADDQGTKYMKKDGNLFVYTEELEEVMPITGHMLRESMMGSDLSYEDTVDNNTLESQYNGKIINENAVFDGDTKFKGRSVWILELTAKNNTISYAKRVIWVDKETFAPLRTEMYALSGAKLKESSVLDARWIGDRYFTTDFQLKDLLRKDSKTIFKMTKLELDVNIPDSMFSLRNLEN